MKDMTPQELAMRYALGELTDVQLNYWIKTRKLDSQEVEDLIEWYRGSTQRVAAMCVLCVFFTLMPLIAIILALINF